MKKKKGLWILPLLMVSLAFTFHLRPYQFQGLDYFPEMPLPDYDISVEGAELGRHLFYDPILSRDSSMSCASCHKQAFAFSDANLRKSIGIHGDSSLRNSMPLFNLAWYEAFFWDGHAESIEAQVFFPVRDSTEMDLSWKEVEERLNRHPFYKKQFLKIYGKSYIDSTLVARSIAEFERTLISNRSKYDQVLEGSVRFDSLELRGFEIMNDMAMGNCMPCHTTDSDALATHGGFSNNGLDQAEKASDYSDLGLALMTEDSMSTAHFKVPSLRNVMLTAPYMHDGRFGTIEEVLEFYSEGVHASYNLDPKMHRASKGEVPLNAQDRAAIIAFLHCLTDSAFVNDPRFSDPWH